jgi:hypothetical protein
MRAHLPIPTYVPDQAYLRTRLLQSGLDLIRSCTLSESSLIWKRFSLLPMPRRASIARRDMRAYLRARLCRLSELPSRGRETAVFTTGSQARKARAKFCFRLCPGRSRVPVADVQTSNGIARTSPDSHRCEKSSCIGRPERPFVWRRERKTWAAVSHRCTAAMPRREPVPCSSCPAAID